MGPHALRDTARMLFAPWSVAEAATTTLAVHVTPGNATIPRGAAVDVHASLVGFAADGAELVFRTDSSSEWVRLPMSRDSADGAFTSRVFDLTRPTEYFVDANGIRSPTYKLSVSDLPAVKKLAIDLRYPAYTGLPTEHIDDGGDVAALVGTTVTVHATITKPVRSGVLKFDDGTSVPFARRQGRPDRGVLPREDERLLSHRSRLRPMARACRARCSTPSKRCPIIRPRCSSRSRAATRR